MPLGMLYTMSHLVSARWRGSEIAVAMATGSSHACLSSKQWQSALPPAKMRTSCWWMPASVARENDALSALSNGDIVGVGAVITDGVPRNGRRSRNTPETVRASRLGGRRCRISAKLCSGSLTLMVDLYYPAQRRCFSRSVTVSPTASLVFAAIALFVIVGICGANVICRHYRRLASSWGEEAMLFLMVLMVFRRARPLLLGRAATCISTCW